MTNSQRSHHETPFHAPLDARALLEHESWIRRLARGLVRDAHDVDDVVQQTWLNALLWPPQRGGDLRGWLATVLRNVVRQRHRGEARARRRDEAGARPEADEKSMDVSERLEWQRKLADTVLSLRPLDREILVLRYYDDMGPRELAAHLGVPLRTVKSRLARAKERLRKRLEESWKRATNGDDWRTSLCLLAFATTVAPRLAMVGGGRGVGLSRWFVTGTAAVMAVGGLVVFWLSTGGSDPSRPVGQTELPEVASKSENLVPAYVAPARQPVVRSAGSALRFAGPVVSPPPSQSSALVEPLAPVPLSVATAQNILGTIVVKVSYSGPAPQQLELDHSEDPVCRPHHGQDGQAVSAPEFRVSAEGLLAEVMVNLTGVPGAQGGGQTEAVLLDQQGCVYEPRVFAVMEGQPIKLLNSDDTLHNVHAMPQKNKKFNLALPTQGMQVLKSFRVAEREIAIQCDVHPWMASTCFVFNHGYFGVSDDRGEVTMPTGELSDGTYKVELWHPVLGSAFTTVDVLGGVGELSYQFSKTLAR
ncbi:MAG: RNA polymerase sigma factor (sigma-70 family) [Pseudohongiellaceae bacterium]|jgi:RNA polymerase sigma factor (sigma-70 family)